MFHTAGHSGCPPHTCPVQAIPEMLMSHDAFSRCHPLVNFIFFAGAIGFGVVVQHPAYMAAGVVSAAVYYLLLRGKAGWKLVLALIPLFVVLSVINPIFNTYGEIELFQLFGRPYTLEALLYGMAIAAIFLVMTLWFGCYNAVLTSDKFTALFGSLIPALSLLLVMVLRMIPHFLGKARQIIGARNAIGMGSNGQHGLRERVSGGMSVLSALTDWALEGSIVTADSMRARGYGAAKRTSFRIYRMTVSDWGLLGLMLALIVFVLFAGGMSATYTPELSVDPLGWGFAAYCVYLSIPTVLHIKEAVTWRILRSGI